MTAGKTAQISEGGEKPTPVNLPDVTYRRPSPDELSSHRVEVVKGDRSQKIQKQ